MLWEIRMDKPLQVGFIDCELLSENSCSNSRGIRSQFCICWVFKNESRCSFINYIMYVFHMSASFSYECLLWVSSMNVSCNLSLQFYIMNAKYGVHRFSVFFQFFQSVSQTNKFISTPIHIACCEKFIITRKVMKID